MPRCSTTAGAAPSTIRPAIGLALQHLPPRRPAARTHLPTPASPRSRPPCTPAQTDYLYFVADAQGHSRFSATLKEHAAAGAGLPPRPSASEVCPIPARPATVRACGIVNPVSDLRSASCVIRQLRNVTNFVCRPSVSEVSRKFCRPRLPAAPTGSPGGRDTRICVETAFNKLARTAASAGLFRCCYSGSDRCYVTRAGSQAPSAPYSGRTPDSYWSTWTNVQGVRPDRRLTVDIDAR